MYMYMYIHYSGRMHTLGTHNHMHVPSDTHAFMRTHWICLCLYTRVACVCVELYVCAHMYLYWCMVLQMCVCVCMYMYDDLGVYVFLYL